MFVPYSLKNPVLISCFFFFTRTSKDPVFLLCVLCLLHAKITSLPHIMSSELLNKN